MLRILSVSRTRSHECSERLEPDIGELISPVLRGGGSGNAVSLLDAMKLTVLQQQNKALECVGLLLFDLEAHRRRFLVAAKLERGVTEFDTYIRNNQKFIPNFGERYRQGDTISTAFVESTINQVVSKRFVKRQQMQWSQKGAHLLLQTRTKVLDGDLEGVFRGWYPQFRPVSAASPTP